MIYFITCGDCQAEYIGETGNELRTRIIEHKNVARRRDPLSALSQHSKSTTHEIDLCYLGKSSAGFRTKAREYTLKNPRRNY